MNIKEVLLTIIFPAGLTLIQLLLPPGRVKATYLWIGFVMLATLSSGISIYASYATPLGTLLIATSAAVPIVFAIIPCHVYIYYLRAMFCHRIGISQMIGGDRLAHGDIIKVNQLGEIVDVIKAIVKQEFSVELKTPLLDIRLNSSIRKELGVHKIGTIQDVRCLFDGHGAVTYKEYEALTDGNEQLVGERIRSVVVPIIAGLNFLPFHR